MEGAGLSNWCEFEKPAGPLCGDVYSVTFLGLPYQSTMDGALKQQMDCLSSGGWKWRSEGCEGDTVSSLSPGFWWFIGNPGIPWWCRWLRICLECRRPGFDPWVGKESTATHSSILACRIPMDREAWRATVHGVTKSQTRLSHWTELNYKADIEFWLCWLAMRCWVNHFSEFGFSSFNNHTQKLKSPLFDIIHQTYGFNITGFDPSLTLPVTKKWFFFFCCA